MILVDTSVWIDHFRRTEPKLVEILAVDLVCVHPFVLGEVALGLPGKSARQIPLLESLPLLPAAFDREVLGFILRRGLAGSGIGYIDAHLLVAAHLVPGTRLWSRDKRLAAEAENLGIGYG